MELNVPRDKLSSIAIEITFVYLGRGVKKKTWDKDFLNPITSVYICITGWYYGSV